MPEVNPDKTKCIYFNLFEVCFETFIQTSKPRDASITKM